MKKYSPNHLGNDPLREIHALEGADINDLETDLRIIRTIREVLSACLQNMDDSRLLVVLSVCRTSKAKLRLMLPRLLGQIDRAGLKADVLLGLNQDPDFSNFFDELRKRVHAIEHVYTEAEARGGESVHSSVSFLSRRYDIGDPAGHDHRIVAVHQVPDERTSGKNLMLRTLIDMILSAVISGTWNRVPSLMLECDDDSILFVEDDHLANPIEELIREMRERHLAALGAHWRSARYSMKLAGEELYEYPDTSIPLDPMYQWMDFSQQEWARCLVGGGTLGETSLLTAVRWPVCHRYPGSLSDDLHRTIYVDQLREPWDVSRRVAVFNDAKGYQQTLRWIRSKLALIEAFGRRPILNLYRSNGIPQKLLDMDLGSLTLLAARLQGEPTASLQGRADW